jgi:hypothetical protein
MRCRSPGFATDTEAKRASAALEALPGAVPAANKGGRRKQFVWTEKYVCGHAGTYHDERKTDISPTKRRSNRQHESVKVGCQAKIFLRKLFGEEDAVEMEYHWKHDGHEVGTLGEMCGSMMPVAVKKWLRERVEEGLDWPQIKNLIRLDEGLLARLSDNSIPITEIPDTLRIAQKDVYNLLRERLRRLAILDPKDGHRSLELWKAKLEQKGYLKVLYQRISAQALDKNHYLFAFVSPWQQMVRRELHSSRETGSYNALAAQELRSDSVPGFDAWLLLLRGRAPREGVPVQRRAQEPTHGSGRASRIYGHAERGAVRGFGLPPSVFWQSD